MAYSAHAQAARSGAWTLRTEPVATPRRRQTSAACNAYAATASDSVMSMLSGSARRGDGLVARKGPTPPPEWSLVGMLAEEAGRIAQKNFNNALAPWMVRAPYLAPHDPQCMWIRRVPMHSRLCGFVDCGHKP
jgi:hypothetical protein